MTATDRPSVTDNARADVLEQGIRAFIRHGQAVPADVTTYDREAVHADLLAVIDDANRAAARTETSTGAIARGEALAAGDPDWMNVTRWPRTETTTEDVRAEVERLLLRHGHAEWTEHDARTVAEVLDSAGLLATARTVNVHPTYTVEYQQKIADELGVEREAVLRALGLAAPLLATARTVTTAHECDSGDFDRTICDCGAMHSYCTICGTRQDDCPHGTTTEEWPRCKASRDGGCDRCHDEHGRHIHCRAETTTTTEDAARAIHRALAPQWMSVAQALGPGQDAYEAMLADIAQALADAGLLATARTRPTREELIDALVMSPLSDTAGTDMRPFEQTADAVLALFRGGDG